MKYLALILMMAAGLVNAAEKTARPETELAQLAAWAASTARRPGRDACPPVFSVDADVDTVLASRLTNLLEAGARRAQGLYVVDDTALGMLPADMRPADRRLVPRLHQDREAGRFILGSEFDAAVGGLSSSAWFFYNNFFAAYAGLHEDFRYADAPLARGTAALAALNVAHRGDLALLPAFKQEAALALLLFNADPELPDILNAEGPDSGALRARVKAAFDKVGFPGGADASVLVLDNISDDNDGMSPAFFDLRELMMEDAAARDRVWSFALRHIPYPGLLAEVGTAVWMRRAPAQRIISELDTVFAERMLLPLELDLAARNIDPVSAATRAVFDTAQFISVFRFIWTYRPEFAGWRDDAALAAALESPDARGEQLADLRLRLIAMLAPDTRESVAPAVRLCTLLAAHPSEPAAVQPAVFLEYMMREGADGLARAYARLDLIWRAMRPLPTGDDEEEIVFSGALGRLTPAEESADPEKARVTFVHPGLEAGVRDMQGRQLAFSDLERERFAGLERNLRRAYAGAGWRGGRVRDAERFRRFMTLYFGSATVSARNAREFAAIYLRAGIGGRAPGWVDTAQSGYFDARARLIEQGRPEDLYEWSRRYMFLLAPAYESHNTEWGDALLQDFMCIAMTIALGNNDEQPDRHQFYHGAGYLAEALHWSRDVAAIVRDRGDGRRVWMPPAGWEDLLRDRLPALASTPGAADTIQRQSDGQIEISALWMQLHKLHYGENLPLNSIAGMAAVQIVLAGAGEYRLDYLIAAPVQDPARLFESTAFDETGPYAGRNLRAITGVSSR